MKGKIVLGNVSRMIWKLLVYKSIPFASSKNESWLT